jgi:hypothetical protein
MERNNKTPASLTPTFVISVGRSGSKSYAASKKWPHEPDNFRPSTKALAKRIAASTKPYGEVSHFWKSELKELTSGYPDAEYVHLVRDGRRVVSSFLNRPHYVEGVRTRRKYQHERLTPHRDDMSRFEKLCWYWRYWNEQIEEGLNSFDYQRVYLEKLNLPKHVNQGPKHIAWNDIQEHTFDRVCGLLMHRYGYRT